ncbi:MAG: hypothetical protein ACLFS6_09915 [Methanomassiliicoccales archaeon]
MKFDRVIVPALAIIVGLFLIMFALTMLDWIPEMSGPLRGMAQLGSMVSFVAGALIASEALPF